MPRPSDVLTEWAGASPHKSALLNPGSAFVAEEEAEAHALPPLLLPSSLAPPPARTPPLATSPVHEEARAGRSQESRETLDSVINPTDA